MPGEDDRARVSGLRGLPETARTGFETSASPLPGHLEHADLIGRAKAVLDGAQNAELMAAFALEIKHSVDHMFDNTRPGDLAVLGDMTRPE